MGNCGSRTFQLELESDLSCDPIRAEQQKYLEDDNEKSDSDETDEDSGDVNDVDDDTVDCNYSSNVSAMMVETPVKTKQPLEQDRITRKANTLDPRDYDYPFENLVLEGGGNKGIAYCGAIKVSAALLFYRPCSRQGEPLTLHHLSWYIVPLLKFVCI